VDRAAVEAAAIRSATEEAIGELEAEWASKMGVSITKAESRVFDLSVAGAPVGEGSFFDWLARKSDDLLAEHNVAPWRPLEDLGDNELLEVTAHPELARRAVDTLIENTEMVSLTVDDLVKFGNPSRAAQHLEILARVLNEAGESADDLISPELRLAVQDVQAAEELLHAARNGFDDIEGLSVTGAGQNLAEAKANLVVMSEELVGSGIRITDVLRSARPGVESITESDLFSPLFVDVWAATLDRLPKIKAGPDGVSFAEQMKQFGVKSVGQTELYQQGTKQAMRDAAIRQLAYYNYMPEVALEMKGVASLGSYNHSSLDLAARALRSNDVVALRGFEDELNVMLHYAWPQMEGKIIVRPSGAVVFESVVDEAAWVTLDDVVGELRKIVPEGENMNVVDLVSIAVEAWRAAPDAMEGASDNLSAWFRNLDAEGGFDFNMEAYEELRGTVDELIASDKKAAAAAAKGVRVPKPTVKQVKVQAATEAMNVVLDAVNSASGGGARTVRALPAEFAALDLGDDIMFHGTTTGKIGEISTRGFGYGGLTRSYDDVVGWAEDAAKRRGGEPVIVAMKISDAPPHVKRHFDKGNMHMADYAPDGAVLPRIPSQAHVNVPKATAKPARGVGSKGLVNVWEANAAVIRAGMPVEVVDKMRSLVDHTLALRNTKVPKRVLDKQLALRGHLWEPLDEAILRSQDDIFDLVDQAQATGRRELEDAADRIRYFQDTLERLNRLGDDTQPGVRQGYADLVDPAAIVPILEEARRAGVDAFEAVKEISERDPEFLLGLALPMRDGKPATIRKWVLKNQERINSWKPIEVTVTGTDRFARLDTVGVGGVFDGALGERTTALLLENMAGNLAAMNTTAGARVLVENVRGFEKWWRSAVTVGRPTFVPRNIIGGVFNGMVIGVGAGHYKYAASLMPALRRLRNKTSTLAEEMAANL
jgi:hypothetical protein